jgi:hypothetical protein
MNNHSRIGGQKRHTHSRGVVALANKSYTRSLERGEGNVGEEFGNTGMYPKIKVTIDQNGNVEFLKNLALARYMAVRLGTAAS